MDKKNFKFFGIFALVIIILSLYFVLAALDAPTGLTFDQNTTANYDKEGIFTVNWTTVTNADNYTIYIYADDVLYTSAKNNSALSYSFNNQTDANYTFTIEAVNATVGQETNSTNISMIVDDTMPDIVYGTGTPTTNTGANRTWIFVNVTITETNNDTITFYLYNSTGTVPAGLVYSNSSNYNSSEPVTINWTGLTNDKAYHFNVIANDSANNSDTSSDRTFYLDGTAPTSVTLTSSSSTTTSLTISISASDALSGFNSSSCTATRSGASISGTGTSQTLTETGLNCGTSYSYTVTCSDRAGNSKASSSTSFSTDACSGGGTTTTTTWTHTYTPSDEQFEEGYTKELAIKNRMKVKIGSTYHHVGVVSVIADKATIEISSDPVQVTLAVGENAKVDVTDDEFYDIYVLLNDIVDSKVDVTIQKIHEEVPEGAGGVETTGEVAGEEEEEEEAPARNLTWLWILIGVVVLAVIIGGGVAAKKRK